MLLNWERLAVNAVRVLITGCGGFLGGALARTMRVIGCHVVGISRRPVAADLISIDLGASEAVARVRSCIARHGVPDVVIHAAARQPGAVSEEQYWASNVRSTANLLEALADSPPKRLIYTSTQSVYGIPVVNPVDESHPTDGTTPYAVTKRASEVLLAEHAVFPVVILRLPSLFGVGQRDSLIDGLARLALRGDTIELFERGLAVRDALHVSEAVDAILAASWRPLARSLTTLNLGRGERVTTGEYAAELVRTLDSKSTIRTSFEPAPYPGLYANVNAARVLLGFAPVHFTEALHAYAQELRAGC